MIKPIPKVLTILTFIFLKTFCVGQSRDSRIIPTAVPFLLVSPDAGTSAMGEAGTAIARDANAMYWNSAAIALVDQKHSISLTYIPWLQNFASDVYQFYGSYIVKLGNKRSVGTSIRYFSLGEQSYRDANDNFISSYSPKEFAVDAAYASKFSEHLSAGLTFRFIYSGLYSDVIEFQEVNPGTALSADVSFKYIKETKNKNTIRGGLVISNIGPKISYFRNGEKSFLPTNLSLGIAYTSILNDDMSLTTSLDIKKLLVPTHPVLNSNGTIQSGKNPQRSVLGAILNSFSDAPGGFKEELREISKGVGAELNFANKIFIRGGYSFQHRSKGVSNYLTAGIGLKYKSGNIDLAQAISNRTPNNMTNTFRLTLQLGL